jgi:gluconolactonase
MYILACDVLPDGSVAHERVFANMPSNEAGKPDGMKVDVEGRVYCTGPGGTWVFESSGTYLGIIRTPEIPLNVGWGGVDNRTMFFTTRNWRGEGASVYSMKMKTQGTRIP